MKLLLVGHGKMGQLVGTLAPQYGCEVVGIIDPASPLHGGGPGDARWDGVDVAIDFSTPDSVVANARALDTSVRMPIDARNETAETSTAISALLVAVSAVKR